MLPAFRKLGITKKGKESNFAQQAASIAGGKAKAKVEPKSTTGVGRTKRK